MTRNLNEQTRHEILRKQRRMVRVSVDIDVFGEQLIGGSHHYEAEGLPKDAIFQGAGRDVISQCFDFFYLHESFEPVQEGQAAPQLMVSLSRRDHA